MRKASTADLCKNISKIKYRRPVDRATRCVNPEFLRLLVGYLREHRVPETGTWYAILQNPGQRVYISGTVYDVLAKVKMDLETSIPIYLACGPENS